MYGIWLGLHMDLSGARTGKPSMYGLHTRAHCPHHRGDYPSALLCYNTGGSCPEPARTDVTRRFMNRNGQLPATSVMNSPRVSYTLTTDQLVKFCTTSFFKDPWTVIVYFCSKDCMDWVDFLTCCSLGDMLLRNIQIIGFPAWFNSELALPLFLEHVPLKTMPFSAKSAAQNVYLPMYA